MANPLYDVMGRSNLGNMEGFVQQFNQFKQQFRGDPKEQVQQLLNSGRVSQSQYNQAVQMANAFRNMLGFK